MTNWSGVFPAVTTKLRQDESVDLEWTQKSIERLIANGVSGVIVLPMLGENASLAMSERETVIRAAKEAVAGRVPLLTGLAEVSAASAAAAARRYEKLGAEGLMAFPSIAYKSDPRETAAWYKGLAGGLRPADHDLQQPDRLWRRRDADVLHELADTAVDRLRQGGVRRHPPRHRHLQRLRRPLRGLLRRRRPDPGKRRAGRDRLGLGHDQCLARPNASSSSTSRVAGASTRPAKLYRIMTPAFHLDTHVKLVQYIKLAEHLVYGAPEWVRAPRLPLEANERQRIAAVIVETKRGLEHIRQTELAV